MSNKQANTSKKTATDKLTTQQQKFVEAMAMPDVKSQTEAAVKAGCPPRNARITACRWLTKANIRQAIEERKKRAIGNAGVTPEEILGSTVFNMRSSMADVLDESGSFDIEKARATGAIDVVKKYHSKTTVDAKTGNKVIITEIEIYSAADARKEVAKYIGLNDENPIR